MNTIIRDLTPIDWGGLTLNNIERNNTFSILVTHIGYDGLAMGVCLFILRIFPKVKPLLNDDEIYLEYINNKKNNNYKNYSKVQSAVDAKTAFEAFLSGSLEDEINSGNSIIISNDRNIYCPSTAQIDTDGYLDFHNSSISGCSSIQRTLLGMMNRAL
jgi:hypothetical protein